MIITVFRSRLRPDIDRAEYDRHAEEMWKAGTAMPGFHSFKSFTAEDGERVTIVEFEDMEAQRAWARHRGHVEAQQAGRDRYYQEYTISISEEVRRSNWSR